MADTADPGTPAKAVGARHIMLGLAGLLALFGLAGFSNAAVGYALFLLATLMLGAGIGLLAIFALTRWFDNKQLYRGYVSAFWLGAWTYVLAVAALSGYFVHEAFAGRVGWNYIVFGPAVLAAIIILDIGIWRVIVQRNLPTIARFGDIWSRDALDQPALRATLVNEVILHRTLLGVSPFRWLRHQLIFWGFGLMFVIEVIAVAFREAFPAFGWGDVWHQPDHPIRLTFDVAYDLTGLMMLVGCVLALAFRAMVNGKEDQKFTDTPTTVFLLVVVLSGFWTEGVRLALSPDAAGTGASFVGLAFAVVSPASQATLDVLWIVHALAACAFIAYVPLKRMVHSCATPIGRMLMSQKGLLVQKKRRVIDGLFRS
ncbi:MAG: respiratory nitrate reductase subunit gamma [Aestuariivirgaceae bacterium]